MRSLYAKLSLGLLVLLVAVGVGYFTLSQTATRHYLQQINHQLNRDLAKNLVADRNLVEDKRLNEEALQTLFMSYMVVNPSIEIYLLDVNGRILSYSADKGVVKRQSVALEPIEQFLQDPMGFPLGDDPRSHLKQKAFSVTPVPSAEDIEGYLYVVLRGQEYDEIEQMAAEQSLAGVRAWVMLFSLAMGLILGLLVFYWLTQRLRRLSLDMRQFQQEVMGNKAQSSQLSSSPEDEIDQLASSFEEMRLRIKQQIKRLEQRDDQRRNLIAQASHDLRTPLASMLGYLESLSLKGKDLPEKERQDYLQVVIRQGQRLNSLVSSLFEMASIEAVETPPELEPIMLPDLLHDVAQKHRLGAEKQGLEIVVDIESALPMVMADVGLLERVLDNLISNAFSHAGASRAIQLQAYKEARDENCVVIAVLDDGKGIADEVQAQIFEPFYRADEDKPEPGHAGLGLAIVKRMMGLLGGNVTVESQLGEGAAFLLRLKVARL